MGPLDSYLPYLLNRAGARLAAAFDAEVRPLGATLQIWRVLAALRERDGRRMGDLAATTSIEVSTLTRLVDGMEKRRWCAGGPRRVMPARSPVATMAAGRRLTDASAAGRRALRAGGPGRLHRPRGGSPQGCAAPPVRQHGRADAAVEIALPDRRSWLRLIRKDEHGPPDLDRRPAPHHRRAAPATRSQDPRRARRAVDRLPEALPVRPGRHDRRRRHGRGLAQGRRAGLHPGRGSAHAADPRAGRQQPGLRPRATSWRPARSA